MKQGLDYFSNQEILWMRLCLDLALQGIGCVSPNPMVGAVIVRGDRVISTGYHAWYGAKHAEKMAIDNARENIRGATLICSLEPCHHTGKQPACVDAIIDSGIGEVIYAQSDPFYKKSNTDLKLKKAGVKVRRGLMEEASKALNWVYNQSIKKSKVFTVLKIASSFDGKIATAKGESRWITGSESRKKVQELRKNLDAVVVGIGTVLADNPKLLVEDWPVFRQPLRCVLDTHLKIPLNSKILDTRRADTRIWTTAAPDHPKIAQLQKMGVGIEFCKAQKEQISLRAFKKDLSRLNIASLLVEGGSRLNRSFLDESEADEIWWFKASKIIAGQDAKVVFGGDSIRVLAKSREIQFQQDIEKLGSDYLFRSEI